MVYVPCAVSSFFEICDREANGKKIRDELRIGARGGGFVIKRGNMTSAAESKGAKDRIFINGQNAPNARTSLKVVELVRRDYPLPAVTVYHQIGPPIGSGFGTSGAGAIGATIALSDLFGLRLRLAQVADYAHRAEIQSITGLGTVISLVSGSGAIGLVTEPGSFSRGRVDSLLEDYDDYILVCACFGPIEKSSVILDEGLRRRVNENGRETLRRVLLERTPSSLLDSSRRFAERTGIASGELLKLADRAKSLGAIGATQNMIGNAIHCLVPKAEKKRFVSRFQKLVPRQALFQSDLSASGPRIFNDRTTEIRKLFGINPA